MTTTMKISDDGRSLVEAFENCDKPIKDKPGQYTTYYDETGVLTIGYGHTNLGNISPHIVPGMVMSKSQCDQALDNDMAEFETSVLKTMAPMALKQTEFDALVSFDFNTGSLAKSSIPSRLKRGDRDGAMNVLLAYNHARVGGNLVVLNGLTRRRQAERLLFLGDVAGALKLAGAHLTDRQNGKPALPKGDTKPPAIEPLPTAAEPWWKRLLKGIFGIK